MSEPKLISPMLDNFAMGDPISEHHGVRCCPAMKNDSDDKYIVKIISVPASQTQLDALLLTGAYPDKESALAYFKEISDGVLDEVKVLQQLSNLEGFLPYEDQQLVPMDNQNGYDIYLLSPYRRSLSRHFIRSPLTHLGAVNLGLDLCAALAACRRSGYLCVDLKPNNIFVTTDQEFRIGDIGFVRLDSLKYTSLPEKYHSAYTAPEIADAFSSLNDTIDVYALGLVLYQAYNNGELPFTGDVAPTEEFPAPAYADYEMAEIILKACAPDPKNRWNDPVEMGQALVNYMQRNGANDTPIVPTAPAIEITTEPEETEAEPETSVADSNTVLNDASEEVSEEATHESAEVGYQEDTDGNLSFLGDFDLDSDAEDAEEILEEDVSYETLTEEVSEILTQADDLAEHPVPDPVVAPDPVEITIPEIPMEEDTENTNSTMETADEPECEDDTANIDSHEPAEAEAQSGNPDVAITTKKRSGRWWKICIPILLILALLAGGVYYYINYYLQQIESVVTNGSEDGLTVYVTSLIDDSKLSVVCADAYGNQITAPVSDGKAVFTNLIPDTGYHIYVQIDGFHKLTGQTSASYSTPVQTSIVQFNAVTGSEDGSVLLSFTVDGKDASSWTVVYSAEGEEERTATFPAHMVTLTGLTIGKEYTFTLTTEEDLYLTGIEEITFTASKLVYAENLEVLSCIDNKLTASWSCPEDVQIDSWTVRCYNSQGYNETIITTETSAVFEGLNHDESYTVEVVAAGMSVSQRTYIPENSVTVSDFKTEAADTQQIKLSWATSRDVPETGWILQYSIDGTDIKESITCTENSAVISPVIPGCSYTVVLQDANGNALLSGKYNCSAAAAENFSSTFGSRNVTRDNLVFRMCKTPSKSNWTYKNVKSGDYTTEFSVAQKASFLIRISTAYKRDSSNVNILYVVRDSNGTPVSMATQSFTWTQMWGNYYCELDIPNMPDMPGSYSISVYFNGGLAHEQNFTVIS